MSEDHFAANLNSYISSFQHDQRIKSIGKKEKVYECMLLLKINYLEEKQQIKRDLPMTIISDSTRQSIKYKIKIYLKYEKGKDNTF